MMKRYEDFVSKDSKKVTFESKKRTGCGLKNKTCNIVADKLSANYPNPPIPEGFTHVTGKRNTGFTIKNIDSEDQYVWIPVESLKSNGTINGKNFSEKFGRRDYMNDVFSENWFIDPLDDEEFQKQIKSVEKYGGFYISRYNISINQVGIPQSKKQVAPCIGKTFNEAKEIASSLINTELVKSHLVYGAEYDSVLEWFIQSKARTYAEIAEDSSSWGNYKNLNVVIANIIGLQDAAVTRSKFTNNVADFAGKVAEWTQEMIDNNHHIIRGGGYLDSGFLMPVAYRMIAREDTRTLRCGFRASLYIK